MNSGRAKRSLPTFILFIGLAAELYFLLGDVPLGRAPASSGTRTPPIGELVSFRNSVKLQNEGELVWEEPAKKQTLYRRQSLLTLDDSGAEVAFLDGTGIMIDEKSLILLERAPDAGGGSYDRIVVRLLHGTLRKSAPRKTSDLLRRLSPKTPRIEIDAGESRLELDPGSELTVTSRPEDPEGARITVHSGEVRAQSPKGSVTIKQGEEARLPKDASGAAPSIRKLPFSLLSPKPGQAIEALGSEQPVRFRWNAQRDVVAGHPQEVEASRDPGFASGVIKMRIPAAEPPLEYVEINVTLPVQEEATRWYWRVRTVGQAGSPPAVSAPEHFWMHPQPLPELRYPVDRAQAQAPSAIDFSWEPFDGATGYELDLQGRAPLIVRDSFARVERLGAGNYRWRVRARLVNGGTSEWSDLRELTMREAVAAPAPTPAAQVSAAAPSEPAPQAPADAADAPPPPAVLEEPTLNPVPAPRHTSFWDLLIASAWAAEGDAEQWVVHLKWKAVKGAGKYKVQVSRDKEFTSVLAEKETGAPEWDWDFKLGMENEQGKAYFRVASVSAAGKVGAFSKPKQIKISKAILASSKYRARARKPEVYDAQDRSEGEQPVSATDAAAHGDLGALAARPKPVIVSSDLIQGPKPPPPLASRIHPSSAQAADEVSEYRAPRAIERPSWKARAETLLAMGYGSGTQSSSDPELSSVDLQSPYLQQKLGVVVELFKAADLDDAAAAWLGEAQLWLAGFRASDGNTDQPAVKPLNFRLNFQRSVNIAEPWQTYLGLTLDRSFRWVAVNDGQAVDAVGALSLGPSARAVRTYRYSGSLLSIREAGLALDLPVSGLLTRGQAGAAFRIWGEWNLASLLKEDALNLTLRLEGETTYLHWRAPAGTNAFGWTFWLAPALVF